MAKHDIVVLNSTSSGFETDLGNNVARIKGDADDLFSVRDSSGINKFSVSTLDESLILNSNVTSSGNISSSLSSTASFGRVDVTNLVGDGSQMTNVNETGHVSSSVQLAARISGAFQHGFELDGENRVISGSATSTGSFNITSSAGTIDITPTADATTEGAETFTVSVRTGSVSGTVVATSNAITINDTSQTPGPTYSIATAGNVTSIDEGSSLTFNVTTTNVADATTLYYTLTNAGDFATSSGSFTITANAGSFSVLPTADTTTEGAETFEAQIRTDSVGGTIVVTSSSITINDTSLTADPTYSVVPQNNATNVDEGTTLLMNVTTTNVDDATTLYWTVTNAGDFTTSSGSFTTPGVSTLPKRFTDINFGEIPDKIDFGICFELVLLSFGKNKLSPSNIRISLVGSDLSK